MKTFHAAIAFFVVFSMLLTTSPAVSIQPTNRETAQWSQSPQLQAPQPTPLSITPPLQPIVGHANAGEKSIPLREMTDAGVPRMASSTYGLPTWHARHSLAASATNRGSAPATVEAPAATTSMPSPSLSFEGITNQGPYVPGDPNGAVGPQHYVQTVNMHFAVYTRTTGALMFAPVAINTLWTGFGAPCETQNNGDPIVLYDQFADRWLISEFAIPISGTAPFIQCVAVSTSGDPTGAYYQYQFQMPAVPGYPGGKFNDYGKWAVWNNSYFMTTNEFSDATGSAFSVGAGIWAINRAQMLTGVSPAFVYIDLGQTNTAFQNILPANLDGMQLPPANAPGYFMEVDKASEPNRWAVDALRLWQFHVDWTQPVSASFGLSGLPNAVLPVTPFTVLPCVVINSLSCIPQPGAPAVDAVGDRLMYRLVYRNFGDHEAIVVNHTVYANNVAGIRWYEVRDPFGTPSIYQQGTYAPDSIYRWMGSIAFDHDGNIAVGYSASSSSVTPSIHYAGRLVSDPPGNLTQGEQTIIAGTGSQTSGFARWGDYSSMSIDPVDDCTFWYTNQYYVTTGDHNWHTRIGAFKFPTCGKGWLTGAVSDLGTSLPISGAVVSALSTSGISTVTRTNAGGLYTLALFSNTYTVTASAYGYQPSSVNAITVTVGNTTTKNIKLTSGPLFTVTGVVTDIVTHIPLAATINVIGYPFMPPTSTTATDAGGLYTLTLAADQIYTLTVSAAFKPSQTRGLGTLTANRVENFALWTQEFLVVVMRQ